MTFLLDINVLIALIDPMNIRHDLAHEWFARMGQQSWATCPLTENGTLRVVGNLRFPNSPGSPGAVVKSLTSLTVQSGHTFWPDDISLLTSKQVDVTRIVTSNQTTDTYLLALAVFHGGSLATFDRRLMPDAVRGGSQALYLITPQLPH